MSMVVSTSSIYVRNDRIEIPTLSQTGDHKFSVNRDLLILEAKPLSNHCVCHFCQALSSWAGQNTPPVQFGLKIRKV
jgi:hypothetical protein